ncbi:MAG TPA: PAS domain-containing protein, partial [Pyrinomonadaceae bacterium]
MDQAREESERRFEAFMGHLPGYAWIKDPGGKYLYINEPLQTVLPVYKNDWRGRTDEELWPANAIEFRGNDLRALQERRKLQTIESWFYRGQLRWLLVSKFPIFDDGNGMLLGGIAIDITEHRHAELSRDKAEERFREIFENAREGIFQSTPEGQYLVANPALARMHGYESPEALIAGCQDISHQIYADPLRREEFKLLLETAGVVTDFEMKTRQKDGSNLWVSVNARAVRDAEGMILYYEGTSQNITDRKRAQEKSAAFATLARKLSGASTQLTAARIIAQTARDLFGWDACNLDLYDAERDWV